MKAIDWGLDGRRLVFLMESDRERAIAVRLVTQAPADSTVEIRPTRRTDAQSRRFHAMAGDIARSGLIWAGKRRTVKEWKNLLVSGHATVTGSPGEIVAGLEGELVAIRESTALMSIKRGSSLIDYTRAFGDFHRVRWTDPAEQQQERGTQYERSS